uniref:Cytochrome b6-f complex subunit 6 n=1 Tax=Avrainvillea sp. HV04061 TaxID=2364086 RepID=A0A3B8DCU2_9CHLO|nr:cytochrome b6-f complex subunit 6 [Avrainvillea sp. HV04061]
MLQIFLYIGILIGIIVLTLIIYLQLLKIKLI